MPSATAIAETKAFIQNYGKDIATAINGSGLYFAAVIGQKCNESTYGTSPLAKRYNNFGGIRYGGGVLGATGSSDGTSKGWAIFPTALDCFLAYVETLKSPTKKYTSYGVFNAGSPEEQVKLIVSAGYCIDTVTKRPEPVKYLSACQSAIDSARQLCPLGKINNLTASINAIQTVV